MSQADVEQRLAKKRRFFVEDSPVADRTVYATSSHDETDASAGNASYSETIQSPTKTVSHDANHIIISQDAGKQEAPNRGFDTEVFASFVGEHVPEETMERLRAAAGDDMERAINMYLDGSWRSIPKATSLSRRNVSVAGSIPSNHDHNTSLSSTKGGRDKAAERTPSVHALPLLSTMPESRYVGAFGVGAWATRSGTNLLRHGESVKVERTKITPPVKLGRGGKMTQIPRNNAARMRTDIIVRFTNARGEEVGRLPKETAAWVSTLLDQKVCKFEGSCVFVPDRIRINDTIYLQLRCSLLRRAFEAGGFVKPSDNNRTTGIFEEKETSEEKDLRLRQVALVKLFDEINLHPTSINETTARHKRQGLLQAAEVAEQYDKDGESNKQKPAGDGGSSPTAADEAEDGKELEQDQLDTLYKKAQSFDFNTPAAEPPSTFTMDLRRYQKQALHWMLGKEKNEKSENKEVSMHPLWEEYTWPKKDVDDKELPEVVHQDRFYVNPYSGELSLDFPVQEQNCLGGILADGRLSLSLSLRRPQAKHFQKWVSGRLLKCSVSCILIDRKLFCSRRVNHLRQSTAYPDYRRMHHPLKLPLVRLWSLRRCPYLISGKVKRPKHHNRVH